MTITLEGIKARREVLMGIGFVLRLSYEEIDFLIEQAEKSNEESIYSKMVAESYEYMEKQNESYQRVIKSIEDEISYALYSNKSEDVKKFYLENAIRLADDVIGDNLY